MKNDQFKQKLILKELVHLCYRREALQLLSLHAPSAPAHDLSKVLEAPAADALAVSIYAFDYSSELPPTHPFQCVFNAV